MAQTERLTQLEKAILGLRSQVMSGEFAGGVRMREVELAERLGISRTPVRQAMDRLVAEGLLERIETGGCRVARFTVDDIYDAIELRGVIEGTAARLAAERGVSLDMFREADAVLDRLDGALSEAPDVNFNAYLRYNARFHDLLWNMAGSAIVRREAERVSRLPLASPSAFLQDQEAIPDFRSSLVRAQVQHRALLEAIQMREGSRAEALAREHARLARSNLNYLTKADPGVATRVPGFSLVTPN